MLETLLTTGSLPLVVSALLAAGLGVPIPEDPVVLAAGVLAHRTPLPWWVLLPVVYVSAIGADCILFAFGRHFGGALLSHYPFKWLASSRRYARVSELLARHGQYAVFVGRHLPGLRSLVFVSAGMAKMRFASFVFWDALAGLLTLPTVFGLGYLFSAHVAAVQAGLARFEHWLAAALGLVLLIAWGIWSARAPHRR